MARVHVDAEPFLISVYLCVEQSHEPFVRKDLVDKVVYSLLCEVVNYFLVSKTSPTLTPFSLKNWLKKRSFLFPIWHLLTDILELSVANTTEDFFNERIVPGLP